MYSRTVKARIDWYARNNVNLTEDTTMIGFGKINQVEGRAHDPKHARANLHFVKSNRIQQNVCNTSNFALFVYII